MSAPGPSQIDRSLDVSPEAIAKSKAMMASLPTETLTSNNYNGWIRWVEDSGKPDSGPDLQASMVFFFDCMPPMPYAMPIAIKGELPPWFATIIYTVNFFQLSNFPLPSGDISASLLSAPRTKPDNFNWLRLVGNVRSYESGHPEHAATIWDKNGQLLATHSQVFAFMPRARLFAKPSDKTAAGGRDRDSKRNVVKSKL